MSTVSDADIHTIGHSTRSLQGLVEALRAHGVRALVDMRRVPSSRHVPHFSREQLEATLPVAGISYLHMGAPGSWRKRSRPDSPNDGWRSPGFRAYADHMLTPAFEGALAQLLALARQAPAAIMCAEAAPRLCHRSLMSDILTARGLTVRHILEAARSQPHRLPPFARREGERVTYSKPS